jgi:alkanesulfonate monooxygenase SsuD/methylene tetrahydromethanopterin reductase-like flavin-dependent oxidoreductase (luciferase family)
VSIAETSEEAREIANTSPFLEEGRKETCLIGKPEMVKAKLEAFTRLGVSYFVIRFLDFPRSDGAMLFAEEVVSQLA